MKRLYRATEHNGLREYRPYARPLAWLESWPMIALYGAVAALTVYLC